MSSPALAAPATSAPPRAWLKWAIAFTAALGALLEVLDTSIVNVALTDMQSSLGATLGEVGWVIAGYAIANVVIIPLSPWLGERFGKKRYFLFSMAAFTVASVLCGLATNLPFLVIARILQGLAGGGLLAKAQAILFETFPKEEQGMAQALFGVAVIAGPAIGPTLGGYLTTNFDWRWIFLINLPVGIAAVFMALAFLPEDPPKIRNAVRKRVDWLGIGLLVVGVGSLQYMLEKGHEEDWFESTMILQLAAAAVLGLGLFVWRELTAEHPAVDLRILRHRSLAAGSVYSAVLGMGLYGALFAVPIFAQTALGYTAYQTGMMMLPGALASAVTMLIVGRLVSRFDPRILIAVGSVMTAGAMFWLQRISPLTSSDNLFWPLILRGVATVMMFLPLSMATLGPLPKKDVAGGSGFYSLTRQLGGSVGIAVLTTLLAQRTAYHHATLAEHVSTSNPAALERIDLLSQAMATRGITPASATEQAYATLERILRLQSSVMSFGDVFHIVGMAFLLCMPLILLLGGRGAKAPADAH
ncbi:MAG: DHA2 family efflux MFS transporter permease subunit [Fimbriimonas sp.]